MTDQGMLVPLTAQQRTLLAPYVQVVAQAQAELQRAFTLLVVGAGVDLTTHSAQLEDDGAAYVRRRLAPPAGQGG